jgi:hypothetical protein
MSQNKSQYVPEQIQYLYKTIDYNSNIISMELQNIIKKIYQDKYSYSGPLCDFHELLDTDDFIDKKEDILTIREIGKNDRNSIFIKDYYTLIDSDPTFFNLYKEFICTHIKPLFPEETMLVYQTTPNLRISFPSSTAIGRRDGDPNPDIIGIHMDAEFNHSAEEINFIIPLTDMFDTNSIYYEQSIHSNVNPENFLNLVIQSNRFFMCYFNQLRHYNRVNTTGKTRLSLDFRIIPYSKYIEKSIESVSCNKKMSIGEYYQTI